MIQYCTSESVSSRRKNRTIDLITYFFILFLGSKDFGIFFIHINSLIHKFMKQRFNSYLYIYIFIFNPLYFH